MNFGIEKDTDIRTSECVVSNAASWCRDEDRSRERKRERNREIERKRVDG